jgi:hypothetical protein
MSDEQKRMQILDMIESGKISASEGLGMIQALVNGEEVQTVAVLQPAAAEQAEASRPEDGELPGSQRPNEAPVLLPADGVSATAESPEDGSQAEVYSPPASLPAEALKWRRWWALPFGVGVGVTILGGLLMYWALQATGVSFWFFFAGVPMALGLILMVLFWQTRNAHWLHLRIEQKNGEWPERIAMSFPLPLRLTAWLLRRYGHRISSLQNTSVDEIILALGNSTTPENPIFIQVEDDEDGERVQIYIG